MSEKLISADYLFAKIDKWVLNCDGISFEELKKTLNNAPAVDAVEVVRCSRCVNNPQIGTRTKGMVWCRKFRSEVRPDDFCSSGERREENEVD